MATTITDVPTKPKIENVMVELNMIKATIDSLYQEYSKTSSSVTGIKDAVSDVRDMLDEIVKISADMSKDSKERNDDALNKMQEAIDFLKTNKEQITEELTKRLGLDEKLETLESRITQINVMFKEIHEAVEEISKSVESLSISTNQLSSSLSVLNNNMKNLGLPSNYIEEAGELIDYLLSRRNGPPVTFGELVLKFNPNTVKRVLMNAHKLGYLEWR